MTTRKIFSNYVVETAQDRTNSSYARVTLKNAGGTVVIDPVGLPVMASAADAVKLFDGGDDLALVTASPLPGGAKVGIVVGSARGAGVSDDVTVTAAGVEVTVLFRDAHVVFDNIDFGLKTTAGVIATGLTQASGPEQTAFRNELEKQSVKNVAKSPAAAPKLV